MDWVRLGEMVKLRRAHLGFTSRREFASATGFPAKTLSDLEAYRRENFDLGTLGRLERALQWPPGTAQAVLDGADPQPVSAAAAVPPSRPRPVQGDGDAWQALARLADVMASLDPQQRAVLLARLDELIAEAGGDVAGR